MVLDALLMVMVAAAGRVMDVPPESVTAPEAAPKIIGPALTAPLTVTTPTVRPAVAVPKFSLVSVVAVETLPGAAVPVESVFQPGIPVFPDDDQVPPAVPKPTPATLSQ